MPYAASEERRAYNKQYYLKNSEILKQRAKDWRETHSEYCREMNKNWRNAHKDQYKSNNRRYRLQKRYGLSEAEFQNLLDNQKGSCSICTESLTKPVIDHCHKSNQIRGILCQRCNILVGFYETHKELLRKIPIYLQT